jgi:hypothetical protein
VCAYEFCGFVVFLLCVETKKIMKIMKEVENQKREDFFLSFFSLSFFPFSSILIINNRVKHTQPPPRVK